MSAKIKESGMNAFEKTLAFYDQNYECIVNWILLPGNKIMLGSKDDGQGCRFCDKRSPEVTFRLDAHAIPESLGNKGLFSAYECDICNQFFGKGIENDFGNWSKPIRTFARIRGKKGSLPSKERGLTDGASNTVTVSLRLRCTKMIHCSR
jgi:hypothetical protein